MALLTIFKILKSSVEGEMAFVSVFVSVSWIGTLNANETTCKKKFTRLSRVSHPPTSRVTHNLSLYHIPIANEEEFLHSGLISD